MTAIHIRYWGIALASLRLVAGNCTSADAGACVTSFEDGKPVIASSCIQHSVKKDVHWPKFAVVVPGHGQPDRTPILRASLQQVSRTIPQFSCLVFVYKNATEFPLSPEDLGISQCQIVRQSGIFMGHLATHTDEEFKAMLGNPDFVLSLSDDVSIGPVTLQHLKLAFFHPHCQSPSAGPEEAAKLAENMNERTEPVNASKVLSMMQAYHLDVAAIGVAHTPFQSQEPYAGDQVGRLLNNFELQAIFMSAKSFFVLKHLIRPELTNAYGMESVFSSGLTLAFNRAARMAVIDTMLAVHEECITSAPSKPWKVRRDAGTKEDVEGYYAYWRQRGVTRAGNIRSLGHFGRRQDWY